MMRLSGLAPQTETPSGSRTRRLGPTRTCFLIAIVSLLPACLAAASFQPADLSRITMGPSDTPLGLRWDPDESGFLSREEMIQHIKEAARLGPNETERLAEEGGIEAGHIALFYPLRVVSGQAELRPPMPVLQVILTLYENEAVAIREFGSVGGDLPDSFYPVERISLAGLGEQSFGVADEPGEEIGFWYFAWRRDNLMVQLVAEGVFDTATMRDLANEIDSRAVALK